MKQSRFIYSSIVMVVMNFIIRIIGFSYDISLSRLLGAEAMGLFQIAMSTMMTFIISSSNYYSFIKFCVKVLFLWNEKCNDT